MCLEGSWKNNMNIVFALYHTKSIWLTSIRKWTNIDSKIRKTVNRKQEKPTKEISFTHKFYTCFVLKCQLPFFWASEEYQDPWLLPGLYLVVVNICNVNQQMDSLSILLSIYLCNSAFQVDESIDIFRK